MSDRKTASVVTANRAGPLNQSVLLYSGGMDSLMYAHLMPASVRLYVTSNTPYTDAETECIKRLEAERESTIPGRLISFTSLDLSRFERDDAIVPNRNAHLVLLASNYGEDIRLASVYGDRSADKDEMFCVHMTNLLDHMWKEQHWTAQRRFRVSMPYKEHTKTQLVAEYLKRGGTPKSLFTSYSCYRGFSKACGVCKPCFRKRVALELNGLEQPEYWERDFWHEEWFHSLLPQIARGQYRGREDDEVLSFLRNKKLIFF